MSGRNGNVVGTGIVMLIATTVMVIWISGSISPLFWTLLAVSVLLCVRSSQKRRGRKH